jgi:hypothetical protein
MFSAILHDACRHPTQEHSCILATILVLPLLNDNMMGILTFPYTTVSSSVVDPDLAHHI